MNEFGRPKASSWVPGPELPPVPTPPPPNDDPFDPLLPQPQPPRSARAPDAPRWFSVNMPVWVRLVWNARSGEIEEVRLRNVTTQAYSSVRPTERLAADIREAFARFVAEDIVAAVYPASGTSMGPPASSAELANVTEGLLDPRLLAAEVVRVTVQIAAVHAGIPPFVARLMGQAAGDLFTKLASPDPDASKVQAVRYMDFALSAAEDGSLTNSPALPQIATAEAANAIDKLLGPDAPAHPTPAARGNPMRAAAPARPTPAARGNPMRAAAPARPTPAAPGSPTPAAPGSPTPAAPASPSLTSEAADPRSRPSPTDIGGLGSGLEV
jgi:hypothetical protein